MSGDQWIQLAIQIAISIPGAMIFGFGVYLGMAKAIAKFEVRVDACEKRLDRIEAPFFDHAPRPSK